MLRTKLATTGDMSFPQIIAEISGMWKLLTCFTSCCHALLAADMLFFTTGDMSFPQLIAEITDMWKVPDVMPKVLS